MFTQQCVHLDNQVVYMCENNYYWFSDNVMEEVKAIMTKNSLNQCRCQLPVLASVVINKNTGIVKDCYTGHVMPIKQPKKTWLKKLLSLRITVEFKT